MKFPSARHRYWLRNTLLWTQQVRVHFAGCASRPRFAIFSPRDCKVSGGCKFSNLNFTEEAAAEKCWSVPVWWGQPWCKQTVNSGFRSWNQCHWIRRCSLWQICIHICSNARSYQSTGCDSESRSHPRRKVEERRRSLQVVWLRLSVDLKDARLFRSVASGAIFRRCPRCLAALSTCLESLPIRKEIRMYTWCKC